jgi:hypothetical protein
MTKTTTPRAAAQQNRLQRRAADSKLSAAQRRFERRGCARCGVKPYHGIVAVTEAAGAVCGACLRPRDQIIASIGIFDTDTPMESDRLFFLENPGVGHRVRRVWPGEIAELKAKAIVGAAQRGVPAVIRTGTEVIVIQYAPGNRVRCPVTLDGLDDAAREVAVADTVAGVLRDNAGWLAQAASKTPEALANEQFASTLLGLDALAGGAEFASQLIGQGRAMRAAKGKPRH